MKFFHLSDLHIGLKLMNRDLREEQMDILRQVTDLAREEQPDAVVIAGDIYDKAVPAAEAVEVFDSFITELKRAVPEAEMMLISGNHDSGLRLNCFREILDEQKVHMIGLPPRREEEYIEKVTLQDEFGPVNFYLLPFVKPSMVKQIVGVDENGNNLSYDATLHKLIAREEVNTAERNVLVSHQFYLPVGENAESVERMDSEIRTVGNIDAVASDVLEAFDYAALGHIHKPMKVGSELYRYCGTPLACSVSEAGQQKGVIMVEIGEKDSKASVKITVLPLKPLREVRIIKGSLEEVLVQACEDFVTVILTDRVDLDIMDMQDRIRMAFPYLLEIRREVLRKADYSEQLMAEKEQDPFELCCSFLKDLDDEEKTILRDVIHTVQGVK
ncbi:MAG: exonuclease SbcCD subunit D [Coprococcus catus]|uniref:exonuclease SbcCD subunit D n=1 Tax=Coprococcus catus TaxID=116085 RepID=UPI001C02D40A|nr:exonuclease SbcCD subunit D [Coprococcus catus]MBT9771380.1 exonuclease subunit SbcD [Coprococcus catus]MCB6492429.1 exonuclease SbcCD subunit D [Coprococcus catus]